MVTLSRLFAITTLVALMLFTFAIHENPAILIDVPSALYVFFGTLTILLVASDSAAWRVTIRLLFRNSRFFSTKELQAAHHWLTIAACGTLGSGATAMVVELLFCVEHGNPYLIVSGLSLGLIPLFYGMLLSVFVFWPLAKAVDYDIRSRQVGQLDEARTVGKQPTGNAA